MARFNLLVNDRVRDAGGVASGASRLHNSVHLVKDDNVEHGGVSHLGLLLLRLRK